MLIVHIVIFVHNMESEFKSKRINSINENSCNKRKENIQVEGKQVKNRTCLNGGSNKTRIETLFELSSTSWHSIV